MADAVRIQRLLRGVTDDLGVLEQEAGADAQRRADPMWLRGVKYAFVTAIGACVDIAQHMCATAGWGPPADNGDAMRLLGVHGVIAPALAENMRRAVGFRNVLVREYIDIDYIDIDDEVVVRRLEDLRDLREFVSHVASHPAAHAD